MPDKLKINESLGIIEISSTGIVTREDIFNSIEKSKKVLAERGISKIIVDTTSQEKMPGTVDVFNLFANFPREFAVAILVSEDQLTRTDIEFAENVSVNRGISVRLFYNKKEAINWLQQA